MTKTEVKKQVRESLLKQLEDKGADIPAFTDMVDDYMKLWGIKEKLAADISKRGVVFKDVSSTGVPMMKNNTSVKEIVGVNRQMLSILDRLNITTDLSKNDEANEDDL